MAKAREIPSKRRLIKRRLISIDPGLAGTGVVHWRDEIPVFATVMRPVMRDVREDTKSGEENLIPRARNLARNLILDSRDFRVFPTLVVIEFPEYQASADRAMGWKTGSLQRLTLLIGVMVGMMPDPWLIELVTPSGWKGQLPKDIVQSRMIREYGHTRLLKSGAVNTHAWDALGIGHWALIRART